MVEDFLADQGLAEPRSHTVLIEKPSRNLLLFRAQFGHAPASRAYGLLIDGRIGWVEAPDGYSGSTALDLSAEDAILVEEELLGEIRNVDRLAYDALLLRLARDADTPDEVLIAVAGALDSGGDRSDQALEIAEALLAHPRTPSNGPVLRSLVLASRLGSTWREVNGRAWELLSSIQPPFEGLEVTSTLARSGDEVSASLLLRNTTSQPIWIEHGAGCQVAIIVVPASNPAADPVWDELDWQNGEVGGGCKLAPSTNAVDPGESLRLTTPEVTDETILGDSIPAGEYLIAARVHVTQPRDTTLVVPAGKVSLGAALARDHAAPIQTGKLLYELEQTDLQWESTIDFTFTNRTAGDAFIAHCQGSYFLELERRVNGAWVLGYARIVPLCLSHVPIHIPPGESFEDSVWVIAGRPGTNMAPKFETSDPEGVYRIVIHPLSSYDINARPFGPELPLDDRVSNPFRIVIAGE